MSVSPRGTPGTPASGSTSATYTLSGVPQKGDFILAWAYNRRSNSPVDIPDGPSGYSFLGSQENATGSYNAGQGDSRLTAWWKVAAGNETSVTASQDTSSGSVIVVWAVVIQPTKFGDMWETPVWTSANDTNDNDTLSGTGANVGFIADDYIVAAGGIPSRDYDGTTGTSLTIPGCSLGGHNNLPYYTTSVGHDAAFHAMWKLVSSGTSTGGPSFSWGIDDNTWFSSLNEGYGPIGFVRIRPIPALTPPLGIASHTHTALKWRIPAWLKFATEIDTSLGITPSKSFELGLASEYNQARPIDLVPTHRPDMGQTEELDSTFGVQERKVPPLGALSETDNAFDIAPRKIPPVGISDEDDSTHPLQPMKRPLLGCPVDTSSVPAPGIRPRKIPPLGLPEHGHSPGSVHPRKIPNLGLTRQGLFALPMLASLEPIIQADLDDLAIPVHVGEDPEIAPFEAIEAVQSESSEIIRKCDIYESDGVTEWMLDAPLISGGVTVDANRDERRMFDAVFDNTDRALDNYPGGFWYDKVLRFYRGVKWDGVAPSSLYFTGSNKSYIYTPDSVRLTLRAGFQIHVELAANDWTNSENQTIYAKWNEAEGERSFMFYIRTDGKLALKVSTLGTDVLEFVSALALPVQNRHAAQVSVAYTAANASNNAEAKFAYSVDGTSTIQLGGATIPGQQPVFDSFAAATIGAHDEAGLECFKGDIMWVDLHKHQSQGDHVFHLDFSETRSGTETFLDEISNFVFRRGGSGVLVRGGKPEKKSWLKLLGVFRIDKIDSPNFPRTTSVSGRDFTSKLLDDGFDSATSFPATALVEDVIRAIATNGGITQFKIDATGQTLGKEMAFNADTTRWEAIKKLAESVNCDIFMANTGELTMRQFRDPSTSPKVFTFKTGSEGNLASYSKSSNQSRLKNVVVVVSEAGGEIPTVMSRMENTNPESPTNVDVLGRRTYRYKTQVQMTQEQCDALATSLLAVQSLESWEIRLESIVIPWLDANEVVEFVDPEPNPGEPTVFLMTDFNVPLNLEPMSVNAKRLVVVG